MQDYKVHVFYRVSNLPYQVFSEPINVSCGNRVNAKKYAEKDFNDLVGDICPGLETEIIKLIINENLTDRLITATERELGKELEDKDRALTEEAEAAERECQRRTQEWLRVISEKKRSQKEKRKKAVDFDNFRNSFDENNSLVFEDFLRKYDINNWEGVKAHISEFYENGFSYYMTNKILKAMEDYEKLKDVDF